MSESIDTQLADAVSHRIRDALGQYTGNEPERITVAVHDACVVLKGVARSWQEHERLERIALETRGVRKVDNQLAILVKAKLARVSDVSSCLE